MMIIKLEGKPLEKLITVISKGIGKMYLPRSIRKEADAEAHRIEVTERAIAKAKVESLLIEQNGNERIQDRLIYQEQRRQLNIENVNRIAVEQLNIESTVSDEPVNEDWINRFYNIAQDISDEEMQSLWGRILAGEVKQPKSFSLRTLEILKNLTKEEAAVFNNLSPFAINCEIDAFILKGNNGAMQNFPNINFSDILLLSEVGLIQSDSSICYEFIKEDGDEVFYLTCGSQILKFNKKAKTPIFDISIYYFTKAGAELLKLIKPMPPKEYLDLLVNSIVRNGITVKHSEILENVNKEPKQTPFVDYIFNNQD